MKRQLEKILYIIGATLMIVTSMLSIWNITPQSIGIIPGDMVNNMRIGDALSSVILMAIILYMLIKNNIDVINIALACLAITAVKIILFGGNMLVLGATIYNLMLYVYYVLKIKNTKN